MNIFLKKIKQHKHRNLLLLLSILTISLIAISSNSNLSTTNLIIDEKKDDISNDIEDVITKDINRDAVPLSSASGEWWNANWHYRLPITITSGNLNNYQVRININLTNYYDLGYIDKTGKDIRFTNLSNVELDYWIEHMDISGGNSTIWVKIPQLSVTSTNKIYMYFGNPNAVSKSNGTSTFDLFDDFNDDVLDSKWYNSLSDYQLSDGKLRINAGGLGLNDPLDFNISDGYMVETKILFNELASGYSGTIPEISSSRFTAGSNANGDATILYMRENSQPLIHYWIGTGNVIRSYDYGSGSTNWISAENVWYLTGTSVDGATAELWRNGTALKTFTGISWNNEKPIKYISIGYFTGGGDGQDTTYDWVRIRKYTTNEPTISIGNLENVEYKITCFDLDGRRVPNARVFISNKTRPYLNQTGTSDDNGEVIFTNVSRTGIYNIMVNYTSQNGLYTETVYSKDNIRLYDFTELELYLNLWTIDFDVIDWDNNTIDYGYVVVYNDTQKNQPLANITLQSGTGRATFRWINKSYYTYDVYYRNEDYFQRDTLINNGTIQREDKKRNQVFYVNQTNIYSKNRLEYRVEQTIWAEGSDESKIGHVRIINATINLNNMEDNVSSVEVFYVDSKGDFNKINEASKTYSTTTTQDTIKINTINQYDVFGLKIIVEGGNSSRCNGTIDLHWVETTTPIVQANMSKMHIKVEDGGIGVVGAIVRIWNGSVNTGQSIINLTTSSGEVYGVKGYAYGTIHKIEFWYLIGTNYNITIDIGTQQQVRFNVSYSIIRFGKSHG